MDSTTLILEKRFATFILLKVYRNPGILKKDAIEESEGSMRVKYQTLQQLIDEGLIRVDGGTYKHNAKPLFCTELGEKVGKHLDAIYNLLPRRECPSSEYK